MLYTKFVDKVQWIATQSLWASHFREGQTSTEDDPRSGMPLPATDETLVFIINSTLENDQHTTREETASSKHLSHLCFQDPKLCKWEKSLPSATPTNGKPQSSSQEDCIWHLYYTKQEWEVLHHLLHTSDMSSPDFVPKRKGTTWQEIVQSEMSHEVTPSYDIHQQTWFTDQNTRLSQMLGGSNTT